MTKLPYVSSPGNIAKALNGIKTAAVPETVGLDFVKTILKIPGGSGNQINSFLKKIGLSEPSGRPTELYTKFRNPSASGAAAAQALKIGYEPLFTRNQYAHELSDAELIGLITEETGQPHDAGPVKLTATCFKNLKDFASFDNTVGDVQVKEVNHSPIKEDTGAVPKTNEDNRSLGLNLGYTININLPATTDQAVYNSIFKAIKSNLLSSEDG